MPITIGSNIASLSAQRQLGKVSESLSRSYERLSSGMRINRASDDAAGLAISSSLTADSRIFTKGIQNLNDGVSALLIADGMLSSLGDVVIRQKELAEQAANGSYSSKQRLSMQQEADALTKEMNRIISTTKFNGIQLYQNGTQSLDLQAGYSQIATSLGAHLQQASGTGSFSGPSSDFSGSATFGEANLVDVDGDGNQDIVIGRNSAQIRVSFGNGDGTFGTQQVLAAGSSPNGEVYVFDYDNDGDNDLVYGSSAGLKAIEQTSSRVFGTQGTFNATVTQLLAVGDFNGDGIKDLFTGNGSLNHVLHGNDDGTFGAAITAGSVGFGFHYFAADFNGDGKDDLLSVGGNGGRMNVFIVQADGTFQNSYTQGFGEHATASYGDFNRDGIIDLAISSEANDSVYTLIGNGDGTFRSSVSYTTGAADPNGITIYDFDGDGVQDLGYYLNGSTSLAIRKGNGDGTFSSEMTSSHSLSIPGAAAAGMNGNQYFRVGDVNNDGVADLITNGITAGTGSYLYIQNATKVNTLDYIDITTAQNARTALDQTSEMLNKIALERSTIGASQSRLSSALNTLATSRENFLAASSRIMDVDIAEESAILTARRIGQQAAAAILSQANQQPALAIQLLKGN